MKNMISQIRAEVSRVGAFTITESEFNQLQKEWILRQQGLNLNTPESFKDAICKVAKLADDLKTEYETLHGP